MSPQTKEWFARSIVGMILADGRIAKEELDYLNSLVSFLNDPELANSVSTMLKANEMPALDPLSIDTNEALEIIKHLTIMAVVDENLAKREIRFLKYVNDQLGLPPDIPDRFLSLAKEKLGRAKLNARITSRDFSEQVRCFDLTEEGCMFYCQRNIQGNTTLELHFFKDTLSNNDSNLYAPIEAETTWSRPVQSKHGNFVVGVTFYDPLSPEQGLDLIKTNPSF